MSTVPYWFVIVFWFFALLFLAHIAAYIFAFATDIHGYFLGALVVFLIVVMVCGIVINRPARGSKP